MLGVIIIPLREMEGNYNTEMSAYLSLFIIPLREMEGNYNLVTEAYGIYNIIPLREMEGNYNISDWASRTRIDYTLERDGRELQLAAVFISESKDYTLERDGRELQRWIRKH